jgi:hypothetical protein
MKLQGSVLVFHTEQLRSVFHGGCACDAHVTESSVCHAKEFGGIAAGASCEDHSDRGQRCRIFTSNKVCEFHYSFPILPVFFQSFGSLPEVIRMNRAVFVVQLTPAFCVPLNAQRQIARAA